MPLVSKRLRGDTRLEAAAAFDADRIVPGDTGHHIGKIQSALNLADAAFLMVDGVFGPKTALAIRTYKQRRHLVGPTGEPTGVDAVDKRMLAALDAELSSRRAARRIVSRYLPTLLWQHGNQLRSR